MSPVRVQALGALGLLLMAGSSAGQSPTAPPSAAAPDVLKLRIAHVFDESHPWHKSLERFQELLQAKSNRTLDVQIFPRGVLGGEREYVSQLRQGILDCAVVAPNAVAAVAPEAAFLDLLYLWKDRGHWQRALDGEVGRRVTEIIHKATAKAGTPGFEVLGYWGGSEVHIISRSRGYETMSDLAGVKLRVQDSPLQLEMWKILGAQPVAAPLDSVRAMLEQGRLDATLSANVSNLSLKLYEVAPHLTEVAVSITVRPLLMSGSTWTKLSPQQRSAVVEAAKEATALDRALEAEQGGAAKIAGQPGVKVHVFKERGLLRKMIRPVQRRTATELGVLDLLASIDKAWEGRD